MQLVEIGTKGELYLGGEAPFASKALSLAASTDTRRSSRTRKSNNRARFWSRKEGENAARDGSSRVNEKNVDWGELFVEDLTLLH